MRDPNNTKWPAYTQRTLAFRDVNRSLREIHNTLCLSPQILHKDCFYFLLGPLLVPRETGNKAYAKFGETNKK